MKIRMTFLLIFVAVESFFFLQINARGHVFSFKKKRNFLS